MCNSRRNSNLILMLLPLALFLAGVSVCDAANDARAHWYAGTWDSTLYLRAEHPKTIAIRMELLDKDTHLPIRGVNVSLEGEYWEAWISQSIIDAQNYQGWDIFVDLEKRQPQRKEFRLDAISDSKGIVVFALGWQKEYPWDSKVGDKWTYSVGDEWIIYFDDIEKVERLEIRHPRYRYVEAPLDFKHIVDLKQYLDPKRIVADKHGLFQQNWQNEIKRKNVKLFVLNLDESFPDFNNKSSQRAEFFEKVRAKDYGLVYRDIDNLPNVGSEIKCGPYFVYDLGEILLERVAQQLEVTSPGSIVARDEDDSDKPWYSQYSGRQASSAFDVVQGSDRSAANAVSGELIDQETQLLKSELARLSQLSSPTIEEIRNDPAKLNDIIQKAGPLKKQLIITGIRALPMVDPDTGQMTTLDDYAQKLAEDMGVGGSLGEDPVATVYMMLFDSNFLVDQARIIRLQDGRYVSLTEAIDVAVSNTDSGLDPEVLKRAVRAAASLHQAYRGGKTQLITKALTTLLFSVSEANALKSAPAALENPSEYKDESLYCPELSMSLKTLTPALCKELGLYVGVQGAVITRIDPDAPPGHDDLKPGMVVESWRHQLVSNAEDLAAKAKNLVSNPATIRAGGRDQILLGIWRWNGTAWERDYEVIVVANKDAKAATEGESDTEVRAGLAREKTIDLGNGLAMEFVLIPEGVFYMGSPSTEKGRDSDESPVRRVQITKPFYMSKYAVTQDQYMAVMKKNPSNFSGRNLPVDSVQWDEAAAFCEKLGSGARLPTEAEWEYACRAGSDTRFYYGDDLNYSQLGEYAWYRDNSGSRTHGVGQKKPNSFGLYDMHGNVWEWCSDWWADNYRNAVSIDPKGPSTGSSRVLRGGCWYSSARYCRSAYRFRNTPDSRSNVIGFRVVLDLN